MLFINTTQYVAFYKTTWVFTPILNINIIGISVLQKMNVETNLRHICMVTFVQDMARFN